MSHSADTHELIGADGISMDYGGAPVIDGFHVSAGPGEIIAFTGPNGCGKSTLLRGLAGLQPMHSDSLRLAGVEMNPNSKVHRRATCAVMDAASWLPDLTVAEHLSLMSETQGASCVNAGGKASRMRGRKSSGGTLSQSKDGDNAARMGTGESSSKDHSRRDPSVTAELAWSAEEAINAMGLWGLEERLPHQLSSGQRQRAALSLALVRPWSVLFMDEPEQRLDVSYQQILAELLRDLVTVGQRCVIMATHSRRLLEECGAREIRMGHSAAAQGDMQSQGPQAAPSLTSDEAELPLGDFDAR